METDFRKSLKVWRPDFLRTHDLDPFRIESGRVAVDNFLFRIACAFDRIIFHYTAMMLMFTQHFATVTLIINADATTRNDAHLIGSFLIFLHHEKTRTGFASHE